MAALVLLAGCATTPPAPIESGHRPAADSDEGGLWFAVSEWEKQLERSPSRMRDAALEDYVHALTCRLAQDLCRDIRPYLVRQPYFNAFMAPNGMMVLYSGLLLRVEDESQLAFVIAHEIAHYRQRDSLHNWRQTRNTGNVLAAIQLVGGAVGSSAVGLAGVIGAYATLASFSREQEREADAEAADRLAELGYDLASAARLWHAVHEEEKVNPRGLLSAIFATHPATEARLAWLDQRAQAAGAGDRSAASSRFEPVLAPFRRQWLADELGRRNYAQSEVLLARLGRRAGWEADVLYAQGELYRRRAQPGDEERAFVAYRAAAAHPDAAAEVYRALGQAHQRRGEPAAARAAFRRYLDLAPKASDRAMIESYLAALESAP